LKLLDRRKNVRAERAWRGWLHGLRTRGIRTESNREHDS
jgi:hypothetical protein